MFLKKLLIIGVLAASQLHMQNGSAHVHAQDAKPSQAQSAAPSVEAPPAQERNDARSKQDDPLRKRLVDPLIANWPILVVGIGTLWVIGIQAREMARATRAMRDSTSEIHNQTAVLRDSVHAAWENVEVAKRSAEAANKNIEIIISKERARITIEPGELDIWPSSRMYHTNEVKFKVFCHGTTPAFIIDRYANVDVTDSDAPSSTNPKIPMSPMSSVFLPNSEGATKSAFIWGTLENAQRSALLEGTLFIHFYGAVQYRDVFQIERHTNFRYLWKFYSGSKTAGSDERSGYWMKCGNKEDNEWT